MGALDGRVAVVTGAGRGLGRAHALMCAVEGAAVVVNDLGSAVDGTGEDRTAAQQVVEEIRDNGGQAIANADNVADWEGAQRLVRAAIDTFGDLHILVNNAGILRDRVTVNMAEDEWDAVIAVHMKGHFCTTRWAAVYWRDQHKAGHDVQASIVNTSSASGLFGAFGQLNYAAAKAGIAAMTLVAAMELGRYGVRVNCIAPIARTRLTLAAPGAEQTMAAPNESADFDALDPANISPLVAFLATRDCPVTGGVFHVAGSEVALLDGWRAMAPVRTQGRWTVADLAAAAPTLLNGRPPIASLGGDIAALFAGVGI